MLKKLNTLFFRVAISLLSLAILFFSVRGELTEGLAHLRTVALNPFLVAFLLSFISLAVVTVRIGAILSLQGIHLSFWRRYYLWMISLFFNLFLPSAVGGDIAKAYYIAKDSGKKMASVTSVLLDRFFGMMATISIGFFAYVSARGHIDDPKIGRLLFWIAGVVILCVLFMLSRRFSRPAKSLILTLAPKRFHGRLGQFFDALEVYRRQHLSFLASYVHSLAAQALFILQVYFLAVSIHLDLPLAIFFLFMPLVTVVSMIPSIGGLGVREAAMVYLFRGYVSVPEAVALSLMFDLFLYGLGFACGILYAFRGGASIRELENMETRYEH